MSDLYKSTRTAILKSNGVIAIGGKGVFHPLGFWYDDGLGCTAQLKSPGQLYKAVRRDDLRTFISASDRKSLRAKVLDYYNAIH